MSREDKRALAAILPPSLFGSILIALISSIWFMAMNEPAGVPSLGEDAKRMISIGCISTLVPSVLIVGYSLFCAFRVIRPKSEKVTFSTATSQAA